MPSLWEWLNMDVSEAFNRVKQSHTDSKLFKQQSAAVFEVLHDEEKLAAALNAVSDKQRFFDNKAAALLARLTEDGQVESFRVALKYCADDPNWSVSTVVGRDSHGYAVYGPTSLLGYALEKRNHDVALEIASHPRLSMDTASRTSGKSFNEILDQAKHSGMSDVHDALKKRVAEVYRQRAAELDVEPIKL